MRVFVRHNGVGGLALAGLSGLLLSLSFPPFDLSGLAWVALVPLLLAVQQRGLKKALILSYVSGVISFGLILSWLGNVPDVNLFHIVFVYGYLALYFALWGGAVCWICKRTAWPLALVAPPLWVAQEYLRSQFFFLAFPFMLLGHSQFQHPSLIQITSLTGTYGLSFLIVLVNAIMADAIGHVSRAESSWRVSFDRHNHVLLSLTVGSLMLVGTIGYGVVVLSNTSAYPQERLALVQANIPLSEHWKREYSSTIVAKHEAISRQASRHAPRLIVWPESAVPADVQHSKRLRQWVSSFAKETGSYLLAGSSEQGKFEGEALKGKLYNNMVLFSPEGNVEGVYRKIMLVPFGEYLPLKEYVRWPRAIAPISPDFLPGDEYTIFDMGGSRFAAMICWEVMYPDLFREFVRRGADFIVSGHNAAWFGASAISYQYRAVATVLAAQHRRAIATVGNTGVTAFIDPYGRIINRLRSRDGRELFVEGFLVDNIPVSHEMTFYTRYGELFVFLQLTLCGSLFFLAFLKGWIPRPARTGLQVDPLPLPNNLLAHQGEERRS